MSDQLNDDGLIPGQAVDFETMMRIRRKHVEAQRHVKSEPKRAKSKPKRPRSGQPKDGDDQGQGVADRLLAADEKASQG